MNMKTEQIEKTISATFKVLGSPFRIRLLYAIGRGEACVCHLKALLNKRQAYISQHLMVLRGAGILETRRDGKYIFYRVVDKNLFDMLNTAAAIHKIPHEALPQPAEPGIYDNCPCPTCDTKSK